MEVGNVSGAVDFSRLLDDVVILDKSGVECNCLENVTIQIIARRNTEQNTKNHFFPNINKDPEDPL